MSSQRPPTRRKPSRRVNRRMQTIATATRADGLPGAAVFWNVQRPRLLALFASLLAVAVLFEFFNADFFYVFGLDIRGINYLTPAEVEKASGAIGYNVFFVDPNAVERAVAKLPEVKSVHVSASVPHNVAVDVDEREPEIIWQRGTETDWVDGDGVLFRARASLANLPSIRDQDQTPVKPGESVPAAALAAYHTLVSLWPQAPHTFEWSAARGLGYGDEHGWKIYLGDSNAMAGKLVTLRSLVPRIVAKGTKITFIDLSKGDPFYQ